MLDVHRLRLLRELQRRGTLAEVARALSYSPSAISQQLSRLETETGVQLLERVGRGVRLTEQARILVRHTDAVLERLERAEAELTASLTEVGGTLRVASFQSVLLTLIPAALTRLAEQHPGLRVEMTQREPEQAFAGLLTHDFDVVLGEEYAGEPGVAVPGVDEEDLLLDEIRLALPRSGRWSDAGTALADLAGAPWVLDPADSPPGRWARTLCRGAGFEPDVRFDSPDYLLHVHLVETGHALAVLPDLLWTDREADLRLVPLPGRPTRRLFTGVRRGAAGHPAIRAFRASLRSAVDGA
ncbi:DNA-binding transcriptional regulator, LysR family [Geodermatophilus saharensis]|uniref:DNA-binding transcriptional regulator, LysR family n=1 Tax=Geodermatophilus saharensis TaxID=1137994 RepID=A0A238ZZE3_9ACTN|nr:LysR family transcriptional regulator [Geodermatophilus saharensis]SNR88401.1 DNA-binding transcriptional regulator, LysR family [Geodermatophilus saharensis]